MNILAYLPFLGPVLLGLSAYGMTFLPVVSADWAPTSFYQVRPDQASLPSPAGIEDLRITEVMYQPLDAGGLDGDSLEYIELKNTGSTPVALDGVTFSDGIGFVFAGGTTLDAGAFVVLAANAVEFTAHYGFAPDGDYQGRLANDGEQVTLLDASGGVLASFRYADRHPWPLGPNGAGFALVPLSDDAGLDLNDPANWQGGQYGGTPGAEEPALPAIAPIQVNEVLTHTDVPFKDAVELYNPTDGAVDLSGWYLTDEKEVPRKFKLPAGTSIAAQGYLVFDEDDFNPVPGIDPGFALSSDGDAIYLFSADAEDTLTGYVRGFTFGSVENGVSFGREVWASGEEELLPQISETLGRENSGARIGPVVISELMYGPPVGADEFIELVNISSQTIALFDQQFPEHLWRIEGIDYTFPADAALGPGAIALVVPLPPDLFRATYNVPASVTIYGPYTGRLNNAGEAIQLQAPDDPDLDGTVPYVNVDEVVYSDDAPWPAAADGGGASLYKTNLDGLSNDPANWQALANGGTPGFVDLGSVSVERPDWGTEILIATAYPNPFSVSTVVRFTTRSTAQVRVALYDVLGRQVYTLWDGMVAGGIAQEVRIERGNLPAGTYYLRIAGAGGTTLPLTVK